MNLIPNIPAKAFSFSAIVVGYLLIDDLTANEQNALGNWLMLTAQVLSTNAFYKQVQQERSTNGANNMNNNDSNITIKENIAILQKMVNALNKEIETLKSDANY
ncbi:MAG: hypothetical protein ACI4OT_02970 [Bacilli bacterium]